MYFGSVKFFKHLILSIVCFLFVILILIAVAFGIGFFSQREKAEATMAKYKATIANDSLHIPQDMNFDELYAALKQKGYTTTEIVDMLTKNDNQTMSEIYKNHFYSSDADTSNAYTALYPDLYTTPPTQFVEKDKTIYLTFDDGPSENTLAVLSILDKYNIKATFFMCGSKSDNDKEIMKKVADDGHSIGMHSLSHNYTKIYSSVDSYLEDFNNTYNNIYEATGVKPNIFRFPGGSINDYNKLDYQQIIAETTRRGFVYYDWSASGGDTADGANWASIYSNVLNGTKGKDRAVILLHDSQGHEKTVTVLEDIIIELQNKGYTFDKITNEVKPVTFGYTN